VQPATLRREAKVHARGVIFLCAAPKADAQPVFVRGFVFAETGVAVNSHDRAGAIGGGVKLNVRGEGLQAGSESDGEFEGGALDVGEVILLMCFKPHTVVVVFDVFEELQSLGWKTGEGGYGRLLLWDGTMIMK